MAGAGSRFSAAGYKDPKPLIPVRGVPMVELVVRNLRPSAPHRFIFICQRAHLQAYELTPRLQAWAPGCEVIGLDGLTEGAACTVLTAQALIDNDQALMIANSDQYIDAPIDRYLDDMAQRSLDGIIMTMEADDPKWSFAAVDENGLVTEVAEKRVISRHATVGIYNFAKGREFVRAAHSMIGQDKRVNGEFYVAPVYNELAAAGQRIGIHGIGSEAAGMYGLGTPADLDLFLSLPVSERAVPV
jgi:dTDP-glucose pyrophosphorylase